MKEEKKSLEKGRKNPRTEEEEKWAALAPQVVDTAVMYNICEVRPKCA